MEVESTASQQTQYAKKHGKGSRASKEGDRQAHQNGEYAGHGKKDTVEISDEGRLAASMFQPTVSENSVTWNLFGRNGLSGTYTLTKEEFDEKEGLLKSLFTEQEQRRQLWAEEANNDDFVEKLARGDYGTVFNNNGFCVSGKGDAEFLKSILSEEQCIQLGQLVRTEIVSLLEHAAEAEKSIFDALNGKMSTEDAKQVARELGMMCTSTSKIFFNEVTGYTEEIDLENQAANREAGRDLAKYITENYFDDPKEAKAFMDKIDGYIRHSELLDKGYYKSAPDEFELWLKKHGREDNDESREEFNNARKAYNKDNPTYWLDTERTHRMYFEKSPSHIDGSVIVATLREANCDPRSSMLSEEYKAWYSAFDAKVNFVQSIIDNAKQITDFSGNEKWNNLMNLLSKAA
jgi:hypothetical protein